jgi:heme-degrading monooxygenase HmoA
MYATITRRQANSQTQAETRQRATSEFLPKIQQAPGFVAFYVIAGDDGENTAITIWADQAAAEAFRPTAQAWSQTLDSFDVPLRNQTRGEVFLHATA